MERTIKVIFTDIQSKGHGSKDLSLTSMFSEMTRFMANIAISLVSIERTYGTQECVFIHPDKSSDLLVCKHNIFLNN